MAGRLYRRSWPKEPRSPAEEELVGLTYEGPFDDLPASWTDQDHGSRQSRRDALVRVVELPVDGVPGAYRRVGVAIVPAMSSFSGYDVTAHVQEIVSRWGDGRTFAGRIEVVAEDGEQWRVAVRNGRAVEFKPSIVWPDDSEES